MAGRCHLSGWAKAIAVISGAAVSHSAWVYGLLIFPIVLTTSLLSFYDISSTPIWVFSLVFGIIGLLFGILMGLSLGLWTVGPPFLRLLSEPALWASRWAAIAFGAAHWNFIYSIPYGRVGTGSVFWEIIGLFALAALGGGALGFAYHWLANQPDDLISPIRGTSRRTWRRGWTSIAVVLILLALLFRPILSAIGDMLTPVDANLSPILDLPTTGTHWLAATPITAVTTNPQPAITTGPDGRLALAYIQNNQLHLQTGQWLADTQQSDWDIPVIIAEENSLSEPQLIFDDDGRIHLLWVENGALPLQSMH